MARFRTLLPTLLGVLVLSISSASASESDRTSLAQGPRAYAIGDSVLLGAKQELRDLGIRVDAVEGRQPQRLRGAISDLPKDGRPIVIHLGTNGLFDQETCRDLIRGVDGRRDVVLVTVHAPRSWVSGSNKTIRSCARKMKDSSVGLINWHRIARTFPNLVYGDGIHLQPAGVETLVDLIRKELTRF